LLRITRYFSRWIRKIKSGHRFTRIDDGLIREYQV
jgi:hypothetical protein